MGPVGLMEPMSPVGPIPSSENQYLAHSHNHYQGKHHHREPMAVAGIAEQAVELIIADILDRWEY